MRFEKIRKKIEKGLAVTIATVMLFTGMNGTTFARESAADLSTEAGTEAGADVQTHSETDADAETPDAETSEAVVNDAALYSNEVATYAANWSDAESSYMKYAGKGNNTIDIQGKYNGNWIKTTFSNGGYAVESQELGSATIEATPKFSYGGRFVTITYKVTANTSAISDGKLGVHADVQIGNNDNAAVTLVKENGNAVGFQMIDDQSENASYNACFQLYFAGSTLGGSQASTYWMGEYRERYSNVYNQVTGESVTNIDSGIALSWQNINLQPGESKEFKIMLGVGSQQDLQDAIGSDADYKQEAITGLEPGDYEITVDGTTYTFTGVTDDGIPFKGTDSTGKTYDFMGKKLSIAKKKSDGTSGKSSDLEIVQRPATPDAINMDTIQAETDTRSTQVTVNSADAEQEYILVPEGTTVTEAMWERAQRTAAGTDVIFTTDANGNPLDKTTKYVIYNRKYATDLKPRSDAQGPSDVIEIHIHTMKYEALGNTITAKCTSETPKKCSYYDAPLKLVLNAADSGYTGTAYTNYAFKDWDTWNRITGASIAKQVFYNADENGNRIGEPFTEAPIQVGNYVMEATVTIENTEYVVSDAFAIRYLDAAADIVGTQGNHGWYISNVTLQPKAGYQISTDGQNWEYRLTYSAQGTTTVTYYIRQAATGYMTDRKTAEFQIDTDMPTGEILLENQKSDILGKFFKDIVHVSITANDATSGIAEIAYFKIAKGSTVDLANAAWVPGSTFVIKANDKSDIYARLTDNAGNKTYINEQGIVVYTDAVQTAEETFERKSSKDIKTGIIVNDNQVTSVKNGADTLPVSAYDVQDGCLVLKADYLQTLAVGTYTLTVSYDALGEQFVAGTKPNDSVITLMVVRTNGTVTDIQDLSKTYDGTGVKSPEFETTNKVSDGQTNVTFEYKKSDAADSTYTKTAPTAAGTYNVKVTVSEDDTYNTAYAVRTFTIAKKPVMVTPVNAQKHAGMADGAFQFTADGLVGNDQLAGIVVTREAGEKPGTYKLSAVEKQGANPNYEVSFREGTFTIEDHDWSGEWKETRPATAKAEGRKEKTCTVDGCAQKKYDSIPKIGVVETTEFDHVEKDAEISATAPIQEATLNNSKSELVEASGIFTEQEKEKIKNGAESKVWLEISDVNIAEALTDAERASIEQAVEKVAGADATVTYFSADLFKQVEGEAVEQIHEPGMMIRVTIRIPDALQNTDKSLVRTYKILRMHDGVVDVIDGEYNEETGEFTFETDKFSVYAIAYNDVQRTSVTPVKNAPNANVSNKAAAPATGDSFDPVIWLAVMGAALLAILGLLNKRYKDSREEGDKTQK